MCDPNEGPITNALRRLRTNPGDDGAIRDLERELRPFLMQLARGVHRRRDPGLGPGIDSDGVVNAALKSFLGGIPKEEFPALRDHDDVYRILNHLVRRALGDEVRRESQPKRTFKRKRSIEELAAEGSGWEGELARTVEVLEPPVRMILEDLTKYVPAAERQTAMEILELRVEEFTNQQIADKLGLALGTVRRLMARMRDGFNDGEQET